MVLRPRPLWIALGSAFVLAAFYFGLKLHMWQCPQCKRRFFHQDPEPSGLPRSPDFTEERCFNCGYLRSSH